MAEEPIFASAEGSPETVNATDVANVQTDEGGVTAEQLADRTWVVDQLAEVIKTQKARLTDPTADISAVDLQRFTSCLKEAHKLAKETLEQQIDPLKRLSKVKVLDQTEQELRECRQAVEHAKTLDPAKKKRWCRFIDEALRLQAMAKADPLCFWAYAGRTQEGDNEYMRLAPIHKSFMDGFCSDWTGLVQMAHPHSGKSHTLYGYVAWRIAHNPNIRILWLGENDDLATKAVGHIRRVIESKPYRALFPHVRIVGKAEGYQNTATRFAVARTSLAKDYTLEASAWEAGIQGDRYDEVIADDMCSKKVQYADALRERINETWNDVVQTRVVPEHARFRCICTQWHDDDHAGMIAKDIIAEKRDDWAVFKYPVEDDENGDPISIWPDRYTSQHYTAIRWQNKNYDKLYKCETQSKRDQIVSRVVYYPADRNDPHFSELPEEYKKNWLRRLDVIDAAEQWLCIDPAATRASHSSTLWVTQIALTGHGFAFVRRCWQNPAWTARLGDSMDPDEALSVNFRKWLVSKIAGEALFRDRFVTQHDTDERMKEKRELATKILPAQGGIDRVLIEDTGGQRLGTDQWIAFIRDTLRETGIQWLGGIETFQARRGGTKGLLIDKEERLDRSTWYIENGHIRFPGRIILDPQRNKWVPGPSEEETDEQLVQGLLRFPVGKADSVDTITEFILHNETKLHRDLPETNTPMKSDRPQTMGELLAAQIAEAWEPEAPDRERREENEWIAQDSFALAS